MDKNESNQTPPPVAATHPTPPPPLAATHPTPPPPLAATHPTPPPVTAATHPTPPPPLAATHPTPPPDAATYPTPPPPVAATHPTPPQERVTSHHTVQSLLSSAVTAKMDENQNNPTPQPVTAATHPTPPPVIAATHPTLQPVTAATHPTPPRVTSHHTVLTQQTPGTETLTPIGNTSSYQSLPKSNVPHSIFEFGGPSSGGVNRILSAAHHSPPRLQNGITGDQKMRLKRIEKKRNELHEEESKLEKEGNEIITLLVAMLSLYMLVFGGGIVINGGPVVAYITLKKDENTLIIMIIATVCTFVVGIGMSILLAFQKLTRLSWKISVIHRQRENLKIDLGALKISLSTVSGGIDVSGVSDGSAASSSITLESANARIEECLDSLGFNYFYHGHMFYLIATGVIATVFLGIIVSLLLISYNEHRDSDLAVKLGRPFLPI